MSNEDRAKEFLDCLGNGKSIYEIEAEEQEEVEEKRPRNVMNKYLAAVVAAIC